MSPRNVRLTDAEFAVVEPLWEHGPQTIRQLTARLYPAQSSSDYATVQKLLERLEAKGCVHRDRAQSPHLFTAAIEREALIDDHLQQIADRLCEGSLVPVLNQLVRRVSLTAPQRAALQELLDNDGTQSAQSKKSRRSKRS